MCVAAAAVARSNDAVDWAIRVSIDSEKDIDEIFQLVSEAFGITSEIQTAGDPDPWSALDRRGRGDDLRHVLGCPSRIPDR